MRSQYRIRAALISVGLILITLLAVACLPAGDPTPAPTSVTQATTTATGDATPTVRGATPTVTMLTVAPATETPPAVSPPPTNTPTAPTVTPAALTPTPPAPYVMALVDLDVRGDPRPDGAIVGHMAPGQIARVAGSMPDTGAVPDNGWWLLDCPIAAPGPPGEIAAHCWILAGEPYSMAQPDATRIMLASGTSPTTVEGAMEGAEQVHYVFQASAGQLFNIGVSSPGDSVLFHLQGLGDGVIYKHMLSGEISWQGTISQTQDVLLALNATGGEPSYTIEIAVP